MSPTAPGRPLGPGRPINPLSPFMPFTISPGGPGGPGFPRFTKSPSELPVRGPGELCHGFFQMKYKPHTLLLPQTPFPSLL